PRPGRLPLRGSLPAAHHLRPDRRGPPRRPLRTAPRRPGLLLLRHQSRRHLRRRRPDDPRPEPLGPRPGRPDRRDAVRGRDAGELSGPRAAAHTSRRAVAQRVSSCRLDSWSLRSTAETWDSTVFPEMNGCLAISLYAYPRAISRGTSRSRWVRRTEAWSTGGSTVEAQAA